MRSTVYRSAVAVVLLTSCTFACLGSTRLSGTRVRSEDPSKDSSSETRAFSERSISSEFPDGAPVHFGCMKPEVIRDVVRERFGAFRTCYELGRRARPDRQSLIIVKFIIDRGGDVVSVTDYRSTIPDPDVVQCVLKECGTLVFPPTECDGMIGVVYPIRFDPARR